MRCRLILMALLLSLGACQNQTQPGTPSSLSILSPKGAPALALLPLVIDEVDDIEFVDGVDILSAEFIKGQYDVIIAPVNLGAQLSLKQDNPYVLYGVVTWGNLYVVSSDTQANPLAMAIFGQQAVPGKVISVVEPLFKQRYQFDAFASVADVSAQLLASQYSLALLAEPSLSATMMRAQAAGLSLTIAYDIQALWQEKTGFFNYPQAGLFVRKEMSIDEINEVEARFEHIQSYMSDLQEDQTRLDQDTEGIDVDGMGLPPSAILQRALNRMNIQPLWAELEFETIEAFLSEFKLNGLSDFYYHQLQPSQSHQ